MAVGDGRDLPVSEASYDAVLLLGPLYHLTERADRVRALSEARRVVRPGGLVAAAAISRFASLLDGLRTARLAESDLRRIVERDLIDGQHRSPDNRLFTTAFFHHPDELADEVREAGLELDGVLGVEGPAWLLGWRWEDEAMREAVLWAARVLEREPSTLGASSHLLAVGRRA